MAAAGPDLTRELAELQTNVAQFNADFANIERLITIYKNVVPTAFDNDDAAHGVFWNGLNAFVDAKNSQHVDIANLASPGDDEWIKSAHDWMNRFDVHIRGLEAIAETMTDVDDACYIAEHTNNPLILQFLLNNINTGSIPKVIAKILVNPACNGQALTDVILQIKQLDDGGLEALLTDASIANNPDAITKIVSKCKSAGPNSLVAINDAIAALSPTQLTEILKFANNYKDNTDKTTIAVIAANANCTGLALPELAKAININATKDPGDKLTADQLKDILAKPALQTPDIIAAIAAHGGCTNRAAEKALAVAITNCRSLTETQLATMLENRLINSSPEIVVALATHQNCKGTAVEKLPKAINAAFNLNDEELANILDKHATHKATVAAIKRSKNISAKAFAKLPENEKSAFRDEAKSCEVARVKFLAELNDEEIIRNFFKNAKLFTKGRTPDATLFRLIGAQPVAATIAAETQDLAKVLFLARTDNPAVLRALQVSLEDGGALHKKKLNAADRGKIDDALFAAIGRIGANLHAATPEQIAFIVEHDKAHRSWVTGHDNLTPTLATIIAKDCDENSLFDLLRHRDADTKFLTNKDFVEALLSNPNSEERELQHVLDTPHQDPIERHKHLSTIAGHKGLAHTQALWLAEHGDWEVFKALIERNDNKFSTLMKYQPFAAAAMRNTDPKIKFWGQIAGNDQTADLNIVSQHIIANKDLAMDLIASLHPDKLSVEAATAIVNRVDANVVENLLATQLEHTARFMQNDAFRQAISTKLPVTHHLALMAHIADPATAAQGIIGSLDAITVPVTDNTYKAKQIAYYLAAKNKNLSAEGAAKVTSFVKNLWGDLESFGYTIDYSNLRTFDALMQHGNINDFLANPKFVANALAICAKFTQSFPAVASSRYKYIITLATHAIQKFADNSELVKAAITANTANDGSAINANIDKMAVALGAQLPVESAIVIAKRCELAELQKLLENAEFLENDDFRAAALNNPNVTPAEINTITLGNPEATGPEIDAAVAASKTHDALVATRETLSIDSAKIIIARCDLETLNKLVANPNFETFLANAAFVDELFKNAINLETFANKADNPALLAVIARKTDKVAILQALLENTAVTIQQNAALLRVVITNEKISDLAAQTTKIDVAKIIAGATQQQPVLGELLKNPAFQGSPAVLLSVARNKSAPSLYPDIRQKLTAILDTADKPAAPAGGVAVAGMPAAAPRKLTTEELINIAINPAADADLLTRMIGRDDVKADINVLAAIVQNKECSDEFYEQILPLVKTAFATTNDNAAIQQFSQDSSDKLMLAVLEDENIARQIVAALAADGYENLNCINWVLEKVNNIHKDLAEGTLFDALVELRERQSVLQEAKETEEALTGELKNEDPGLGAGGDDNTNPDSRQQSGNNDEPGVEADHGVVTVEAWGDLLEDITPSMIKFTAVKPTFTDDGNTVTFAFDTGHNVVMQRDANQRVSLQISRNNASEKAVEKFVELSLKAAKASEGRNINLTGGSAKEVLAVLAQLQKEIAKGAVTVSIDPRLYNSFRAADKAQIGTAMKTLGMNVPEADEPSPAPATLGKFPPAGYENAGEMTRPGTGTGNQFTPARDDSMGGSSLGDEAAAGSDAALAARQLAQLQEVVREGREILVTNRGNFNKKEELHALKGFLDILEETHINGDRLSNGSPIKPEIHQQLLQKFAQNRANILPAAPKPTA